MRLCDLVILKVSHCCSDLLFFHEGVHGVRMTKIHKKKMVFACLLKIQPVKHMGSVFMLFNQSLDQSNMY
jgi:hypothetical protein